ncbi:MAG: D-alanyl-D-alanine carboxypeptidase [Alphaproteobacteria bacterium]|nr:D-alanyl-D-alanine carboxypeptidase [Alphaproteobacteria bacterium]
MRHIACVVAAFCLYIWGAVDARAQTQAAIVVDAATGRVVTELNPDELTYPASLTKMMTLYMVFEALEQRRLQLGEPLPVSTYAATRAPSKLGLDPGDTIVLEDAMLGLVTKSANDAAAVIAERLGGSEENFAAMMTRRAHRLGMRDTSFRNASGLPHPEQVTTARDMAILSLAVVRDFPQHYHVFSTESFTYGGRHHGNHNRLMARYYGMDGIKTGYVNASGFNLASSAERNGRRLIAVVMGGPTARVRDSYMEQLLDAAFDRLADPREARLVLAAADPLKPAVRPLTTRPADVAPIVIRAASADRPAPRIEAGIAPLSLAASELAAIDRAVRGNDRKPTAARTAASAGKSSAAWRVQLASFPTEGAARQAAAKATRAVPALAGARTTIERSQVAGRTVFKARLSGIAEATARNACRTLKSMAACTASS